MPRNNPVKLVCWVVMLSACPVLAAPNPQFLIDLGFDRLSAQLGGDMPTGATIPVTQVESRSGTSPLGGPNYQPDIRGARFAGKTVTFMTPNGGISGHATNTAFLFYSNDNSIAPGINNVEAWYDVHWRRDGFLMTGTPSAPPIPTNQSLVYAHNWVGTENVPATDLEILKRSDWMAAERDVFVIAGNGTASTTNNLMHNAFNGLTGATLLGNHNVFTHDMGDATYSGNRVMPRVVVPVLTAVSDATPILGAAAALMMEHAAAHPEFSLGTRNAGGRIITHAQTTEVLIAALMAGADRRRVTTAANNHTYGVNTAHGLDRRFGAGSMNLFNSFQILRSGQTDSIEDGGAAVNLSNGTAEGYGFAYDPSFGGQNGSNATGTYQFTTAPGRNWLAATLSWNINVLDATGQQAELYDLDLKLLDVTDPMSPVVLAASTDTQHNTETLWRRLPNHRTYQLQVTPKAGQDPFEWDYGLAWRLTPDYGDVDGDGDLDADDIDTLTASYGITNPRADLSGDGAVTAADLNLLVNDAIGTVFGDVDLDGVVTISDLSILATRFNQPGGWADGDQNGNGMVDISDLSKVALFFGQSGGIAAGTASAAAIPAPPAVMLPIMLSGLCRLRRPTNDRQRAAG